MIPGRRQYLRPVRCDHLGHVVFTRLQTADLPVAGIIRCRVTLIRIPAAVLVRIDVDSPVFESRVADVIKLEAGYAAW